MRRITLIAISLALIISQAPALAQEDNSPWVEVNGDGLMMVLTRAPEADCNANDPTAPVQLNLPGDCGRPLGLKNHFLIYAQNPWCEDSICFADRAVGGLFAWGALRQGDSVRLFDGAQEWAGQVISVVYNVQPQEEFPCPDGATCGVLCTGIMRRPNWIVVRFALVPAAKLAL